MAENPALTVGELEDKLRRYPKDLPVMFVPDGLGPAPKGGWPVMFVTGVDAGGDTTLELSTG